MADVDVIVIGSGAGGLTAALGCALAGKKVVIIEQHYLPGGWCHSFPLGGHQYSPGVHYIGALEEGGQMRDLYEGLGLAKHLTFLELNPEGFDHVWIGDDFKFDIPAGFTKFKDRLKAYFPHESKGIDRYMDTILALQEELMAGMGAKQRKRDMLKFPIKSPNITRWGLRPLSHLMDKYLSDPMLKAVLSIQAGDHGLPASRAPAALHASVAGHYFKGGWYPKGGASAIPRAYLREIKALGGEIMLETEVTKILTDNGKVTGVKLGDGTEISAPTVISNADPEITLRRLIDEDALSWMTRRKLRNTAYSLSNISLFAAVDMDLEALGYDSGNYWYNKTTDIEATYAAAEDGSSILKEDYDALFVTITTLKDRTKLKGNTHTIEAFNLVSPRAFDKFGGTYGGRPEAYEELKKRLTDSMIKTTERIIPGFAENLTFHELGTPATNRYFVRSADGNMYGTEKSAFQVGQFAFPVTTEIGGLYMVGSATLGHGVAGASISGLVAACKVTGSRMKDLLSHKDASLQLLPCDDLTQWPAKDRRKVERNRKVQKTAAK